MASPLRGLGTRDGSGSCEGTGPKLLTPGIQWCTGHSETLPDFRSSQCARTQGTQILLQGTGQQNQHPQPQRLSGQHGQRISQHPMRLENGPIIVVAASRSHAGACRLAQVRRPKYIAVPPLISCKQSLFGFPTQQQYTRMLWRTLKACRQMKRAPHLLVETVTTTQQADGSKRQRRGIQARKGLAAPCTLGPSVLPCHRHVTTTRCCGRGGP